MKGCIAINMYSLVSSYEYSESFCFVSYNPADLEEMALSYFEEDWYEWFCTIMSEDENISINAAIFDAFDQALSESFEYYEIREATFL